MWFERGPLRYERLTWPEVRRAAAEDRVALVPVAPLEDHGRHLPVDTDLRIVTEICELETSIYLAIDPAVANMDLAVDARGYPEVPATLDADARTLTVDEPALR